MLSSLNILRHFSLFLFGCYLILWTAILDICVEEGSMHPPLQQLSGKFRHLLHSEGLFSFLLILVLICLLAVTIFNLSPNQFCTKIHWLYIHVPFVNDHQPQKLCLCSLQFTSYLLIVLCCHCGWDQGIIAHWKIPMVTDTWTYQKLLLCRKN